MLTTRAATLNDLEAIATIYNQGICSEHVTFETKEQSRDDIQSWMSESKYSLLVEKLLESNVI
jgi:L-amino acid N-acyltransferase YncA